MQFRTSGRSARLLVAVVVLAVLAGVVLFYSFVPTQYWPKCWWLMLTGTECPGCGSQRAVAALLGGNLFEAIAYNPILVVGIPYSLLSVWVDYGKNSNLKQRVRTLFCSANALKITVVVIIAYWIGRNIF